MIDPTTSLSFTDEPEHPACWESLSSVVWRFRWLFLVLVPASMTAGYWAYRIQPTTYQASTRLMFKSDHPLTLDTSEVVGGIPSGKLLESLVVSDIVLSGVTQDDGLACLAQREQLTEQELIALIRGGLRFRTITTRRDSGDRLIGEVTFTGQDRELCRLTVGAVSRSIGDYFRKERDATVHELAELIAAAQGKLLPKQADLESEYQAFRGGTALEWDSDGRVVNPHRQRSILLQRQRDAMAAEIGELDREYRLAVSTQNTIDDPRLVDLVIRGWTEHFDLHEPDRPKPRPRADSDLELQRLTVLQKIAPLQVRRDQLKAQFGGSHPEVKSITLQIRSSLERLNRINDLVAQRRRQLTEQDEALDSSEPNDSNAERAGLAIATYVNGLEERLEIRRRDLATLDAELAKTKNSANALKQAEETDASYRRRIASLQGMLAQLEQKVAELNLVDSARGIVVAPLQRLGDASIVGPNLQKHLLVSGLAGVFASVLLAMLLESTAKTFRSAREIQVATGGLPVLAHVPLEPKTRANVSGVVDQHLTVVHLPHSPISEAIRTIRTAVLFDRRERSSKVFQVTSPMPGDGKSTVAANLGCALALAGKRTLVVDLDLRSPKLTKRFDLDQNIGLTNVLNGEAKITEAVHPTSVEQIEVLPCGPLPSNPSEALTLAKLGDVFQWARAKYDYVIVDTPPLLMVSDPTIVTAHVDAALVVTKVCRNSKPNLTEAISILRWSGARIMGVVVNKLRIGKGFAAYQCNARGSYRAYGYGYGDQYLIEPGTDYVVRGDADSIRRVDPLVASRPKMPTPKKLESSSDRQR